jgi:hypothetical protein
MKDLIFICTRLWRYLGLYFLKPFDAVNDTAVAHLLHSWAWPDTFSEIASGDGVFSYIMHGGSFPLWFDRYLQTDTRQGDMFDVHVNDKTPTTKPPKSPGLNFAIDAKSSHVKKAREIGFARHVIQAHYESLPIVSNSVPMIFYYVPHGLKDHNLAVKEAYRILESNGTMLVLLYNSTFKESFLCHKYSNILT